MSKKPVPFWQNFQIIAYVVAGITAIGTGIIVLNKYLTLPDKVEAGERKNLEQDKQLDKLTTIQQQNQQLMTQQQSIFELLSNRAANAPPQPFRELDEQGTAWCCWEESPDLCWDHQTWKGCE